MVKNEHEPSKVKELKRFFNSSAEVHNKEVASLMGNGFEDGNGQSLSGGLISKYGFLEGKEGQIQKKKQRKWLERFIWRIMIQNSINEMQKAIAYHLQQMELLFKDMTALQKLLMELHEKDKALQETLEEYQEKGAFDLDSAGRLKNGMAEKSLQTWEMVTGKKLDRIGHDTYEALLDIQQVNEAKKRSIETDLDESNKDYKYHKKQKDKAQEILNDLESGNHEKCQRAIERLGSLSFEEEVELALGAQTGNKGAGKEGCGREGLTIEDEVWDDFSFGFPPVQDEFGKASAGENKETGPRKIHGVNGASQTIKPSY